MALYRIRHVWRPRPNVPDQTVVWQWGIDAAVAPTATDLKPLLIAALAAGPTSARLQGMIRSSMRGVELAVYPAAGGAAVSAVNSDDVAAVGSGASFPGQLAIVISQQISASRGVQPKGRIYIGPLASSTWDTSSGAIAVNGINACGNFALAWHGSLLALGCTPCVISADGTVKRGDIVSYAIDNQFDIQRSRQFERTAISYFNP